MSISRSYSLISRFRMSVISPGLMSIDSLSSHETRAQLLELRPKASVEDHAAHARDGAPEQRFVDLDVELELPPRARGQRPAQAFALGVGEGARRDHPRAH